MGRRGAALPTVLALITAVLVAGLAMASLSTLSLQFNRKQLKSARAELAARSGLSLFLARARAADAERTLNPLDPDPVVLSEVLGGPIVYTDGEYSATLHFNQNEAAYSTDNLYGDAPRYGWADTDEPGVPPFSVDLMITVEGPATRQYYRAVLKRVWPYAVYSQAGPILMISQPDENLPTVVTGDVFTSWSAGGIGSLSPAPQPEEPGEILRYMESHAGYQPTSAFGEPFALGAELTFNEPGEPDIIERTDDEVLYSYDLSGTGLDLQEGAGPLGFSVRGYPQTGPSLTDHGNTLNGNFYYDIDTDEGVEPILAGGPGDNVFNGRTIYRRKLLLSPTSDMNSNGELGGRAPVEIFDDVDFTTVPDLEQQLPPEDLLRRFLLPSTTTIKGDEGGGGGSGIQNVFLLDHSINLTEADGTHFSIDGSVSNRQVFYAEPTSGSINPLTGVSTASAGALYVLETNAGLDLEGVVLHVKGDLDLGASQLDNPIRVRGSRATLIVDGTLVLGNAQFEGIEQGFVIYAKHVIFKGGGDFFGLIMGESITMLSGSEQRLKINGALISGGQRGMTLRGAEITHDPKYLKSVNDAGDFNLVSWRELNDR